MSEDIFKELRRVKQSVCLWQGLPPGQINQVLSDLADAAEKETGFLLQQNNKDLERMNPEDPKYDRLQLTPRRIKGIADDIRKVAELECPQGKILSEKTMPGGLLIKKVSVPLGVVGVIYESRPNVTFDVFSLCFKTGNGCVLKGSRDASYSNRAILALIKQVLVANHAPAEMIYLMPDDRSATDVLLRASGLVDVVIPRGSQALIDYVRGHARVPVIETGAGVVHTYMDESADLQKAIAIVDNAKTRRVSVCNALDCFIIHEKRLRDLPAVVAPLAEKGVQLFADQQAYSFLSGCYPARLLSPADESSFGTEFLSLKMAVKTVANLSEAIDHIAAYGSGHSEAVIAEQEAVIHQFLQQVDAAAVYANASTAFTDGAQFGLGAEIGISTQKLHARGPMGLAELTSYKWVVFGQGHTRSS